MITKCQRIDAGYLLFIDERCVEAFVERALYLVHVPFALTIGEQLVGFTDLHAEQCRQIGVVSERIEVGQ